MMLEKEKRIHAVLILMAGLALFFCAKEGLPPGGPVDMTGPQVVSSLPANGSSKVGTDIYIEIEFSEAMNKERTDSSIFVSPVTEETFKYKWKGKKLIIKPSRVLLKDRTYVVTVGAQATDLHENHLAKPYSFAFSTGESVDQGEIDGSVFSWGEATVKASIWAFQVDRREDPNPAINMPEYVTQPDDAGNYKMQFLSLGKYRLYAVGDVNTDLNWDIEEEPIGVSSGDVQLTADRYLKVGCNFVISKRDTAGPSLLACQVLDERKLQLEFDKDPDSVSVLDLDDYKIICESDTSLSPRINCAYVLADQIKKSYLLIESLEPSKSYKLTVDGLADQWANPIDSAFSSCIFSGTNKKDTIPPTILFSSIRDRQSAVPLDAEMEFCFSEPMDMPSVEESFFIKDTSGKSLDGNTKWSNCLVFAFNPRDSLKSNFTYEAGFEAGKVFDLSGNRMSDSLVKIKFVTVDPDTLGQISGEVGISNNSYVSGQIVVEAVSMGNTRGTYRKILRKPGEFRFTDLLPGEYTVGAFIDLNENFRLDLGVPFPFVPSEPRVVYPDTITVRSRWETESVNLSF